MKSWMEFRRIIQAACCVPALEKEKAAIALKAGKTFSQRTTHAHTRTGPKAYYSIHHHDKTLRSDQSQSVLHQCDSRRSRQEGTPCPPAARAVNATPRNTLTCHCHSINQPLGRKHSQSEQTRTRKHLRNRSRYQSHHGYRSPRCLCRSVRSAASTGSKLICSLQSRSRLDTVPCVSNVAAGKKWAQRKERYQI